VTFLITHCALRFETPLSLSFHDDDDLFVLTVIYPFVLMTLFFSFILIALAMHNFDFDFRWLPFFMLCHNDFFLLRSRDTFLKFVLIALAMCDFDFDFRWLAFFMSWTTSFLRLALFILIALAIYFRWLVLTSIRHARKKRITVSSLRLSRVMTLFHPPMSLHRYRFLEVPLLPLRT